MRRCPDCKWTMQESVRGRVASCINPECGLIMEDGYVVGGPLTSRDPTDSPAQLEEKNV